MIHVLMPDGRVTEFKNRAIVIPESGDSGDGIYSVLINGNGELFCTPDGEIAVIPVPVVGIEGVIPDPDAPLSWNQVAKRLNLSLSQTKRWVEEGKLPKPVKVGLRKIAFRAGDIDEAYAKHLVTDDPTQVDQTTD